MDRSQTFQRANRTDRIPSESSREERVRTSQIEQKADRIKELAGRHFEASWQRRLNNEVGRIQQNNFTLDKGPKPPTGAHSEAVEVTASRNIQNSHARRLAKIDSIRDSMHADGRHVGAGRISANRFGIKKG